MLPFHFSLPNYVVADISYGSEQNDEDVIHHRKRTPLITYNMYQREEIQNNAFLTANREDNKKRYVYLSKWGKFYVELPVQSDRPGWLYTNV